MYEDDYEDDYVEPLDPSHRENPCSDCWYREIVDGVVMCRYYGKPVIEVTDYELENCPENYPENYPENCPKNT